MKNSQLTQFLLNVLLVIILIVIGTTLTDFVFKNIWISSMVTVGILILFHYGIQQFLHERKIQDSLKKYEKLEYRKYPIDGITCANPNCKKPNDFLLDWNVVGFKCKHCNTENGLNIQLMAYNKAPDTIVNSL